MLYLPFARATRERGGSRMPLLCLSVNGGVLKVILPYCVLCDVTASAVTLGSLFSFFQSSSDSLTNRECAVFARREDRQGCQPHAQRVTEALQETLGGRRFISGRFVRSFVHCEPEEYSIPSYF